MAALGWLTTLIQPADKSKKEDTTTTVRRPAETAPADIHALWDRFYLCQLHYDNAGVFEAARQAEQGRPD